MRITKLISGLITPLLISCAFVIGLAGNASADAGAVAASCKFTYSNNGFSTSATPVFNSICGVPDVGNEPNFVRIRQDQSGNDEDNVNNPNYSIGAINSTCAAGDKFDLWNYVHNNADQAFNPNVGNGSAVANGVYINMSAPVNTQNTSFTFNATVGASNAQAVTAQTPAVLNCGNNKVDLTLVPGSVHIFSTPYNQWVNLADSSLNTNLPIGSTDSGLTSVGSGTEWGCWTYRMVIVYQVETQPVPAPPKVVPPTCNLLKLESSNGVAKIDSIEYSANGSTVTGYTVTINNGSSNQTISLTDSQLPYTYNMQSGKNYTFTAVVNSNNGTSAVNKNCVAEASYTAPTPPPQTPPTKPTPTTPTTPKQLVNTGPGSVIGLFAGTTLAGGAGFHFFQKKKYARK